jgi:hypothetical protein
MSRHGHHLPGTLCGKSVTHVLNKRINRWVTGGQYPFRAYHCAVAGLEKVKKKLTSSPHAALMAPEDAPKSAMVFIDTFKPVLSEFNVRGARKTPWPWTSCKNAVNLTNCGNKKTKETGERFHHQNYIRINQKSHVAELVVKL